MNQHFPRIITLLRKERGLSQKSVAQELEVSQALLSHYEKGIRECGLDFVVRAADFYNVSSDYLLGRSPDRQGATLTVEDIPEPDAAGKENILRGSLLPTLNKKLLANSLNIIYGILAKCNNKALTTELSGYLNLAVYRVFRLLYSANPQNQQGMFAITKTLGRGRTAAAQEIALSNAEALANAEDVDGMEGLNKGGQPLISPEELAMQYPLFSTSLLNLIQNAETRMGAKNTAKKKE